MHLNKKIKKVWDGISTVLLTMVVILALLLGGVRLLGFQVFAVLSGSMEPTYHTGALIYVRDVDYTRIEAGQVITYMLDEDTVSTHRVVEVVPDEEDPTILRYRTKGDANDAADGSLVHYKNVIGTPVFSIPYLGYLSSYIRTKSGMYMTVSAGALVILLIFLPDLLFEEDEKKKTKKGEESKKTNVEPKG